MLLANRMEIKIQHGILDLVNWNKSSAIIIDNKFILTSSYILNPILSSLSRTEENDKLIKNLLIHQLIKVNDDPIYDKITSQKFTITFDTRKPTDLNSRILTCYKAKLCYIYNSFTIQECFENIFCKIKNLTKQENDLHSFLFSSFLILKLVNMKENDESITDGDFKNFVKKMVIYTKIIGNFNKADEIMAICSPFGIENFYKTIHFGKISNILGRNNCLFTISNSLPLGCEGSAIFNNRLKLIGILICTNIVNGTENFNVTLAANFRYIFTNLSLQFGIGFDQFMNSSVDTPPTWEKSLVIIFCDGQQGTGTFVKVLNKKFIITCSHVVINSKSAPINCRYINGTFLSEIIWKNPNIDEPFDVALLSVPDFISDDYFVQLSHAKPYLGQNVFNAGFPFFTNIVEDFSPGIFEGRVIKYKPGCIISDATLQAGQSGGPMFAENGSILGICVSNLKLQKTVFPNINTSVPACDIKNVIEKFVKTNDVTVLNKLVAPAEIRKVWALETPMIECKL